MRTIMNSRRRREMRQAGQAGLGLVLGLTIILVTTAGILATNVVEHDPLVQNDVVQHYAYRALEAGINTYLSQVNTDSNLINCSSSSPSGGQCNPTDYNTWHEVLGTADRARSLNGTPGVIPPPASTPHAPRCPLRTPNRCST